MHKPLWKSNLASSDTEILFKEFGIKLGQCPWYVCSLFRGSSLLKANSLLLPKSDSMLESHTLCAVLLGLPLVSLLRILV